MPHSVNFQRKTIITTLMSLLLSVFHVVDANAEVHERIIDHLNKDGAEYYAKEGDDVDKDGSKVDIDGGYARYSFDVSEWSYWIHRIRIGVKYSELDIGGAYDDGSEPRFRVYSEKDDAWILWKYLDIDDSSDSTHEQWAAKSTTASDYVDSRGGGRHTIRVQVSAPDVSGDNPDLKVHKVYLKLDLKYDFNTALVKGGPTVVNFGTIDVGVDNKLEDKVDLANIGEGNTTLEWILNKSSNEKHVEWVDERGPYSREPGDIGHPTIKILSANLNPGNISQLEGTLIPINNNMGLDPEEHGLKGNFYHLPNTQTHDLDYALDVEGRHLVASDIFSKIEFHKGSAVEIDDAYDEDDKFNGVEVRRRFLAAFTGFIWIANSGNHTFKITSHNAYRLRIDGERVVSDLVEGEGSLSEEGTISLNKGFHRLTLMYYHYDGNKSLTLQWQRPGETQMSIISGDVLRNSLNVLVRATPKKPTVSFTNAEGNAIAEGDTIHVTVGKQTDFTIEAETPNSVDSFHEYRWQDVVGDEEPGASEVSGTDPWQSFTFGSSGEYTVYCQAVDGKGAESDWTGIPVRAWKRPTVSEAPPDTADVSWYDNKYAGVVGESVRLMADGKTNNSVAGERIEKYLWDLDDNGTFEREQPAGEVVDTTWTTFNLDGEIYCKAVTNYGVESDEKLFSLKVYNALEVDPGGPYTGRPTKPVELTGSINESSYTGATFEYQWRVALDSTLTVSDSTLTTDSDGRAEYTWQDSGRYEAEFKATVTTVEGLALEGSDSTTVVVESGVPESRPGGPYRGGIAGGNYSPVQLAGNHPDEVQSEDVGKIMDWEWTFAEEDTAKGIWNPTHAFEQTGEYEVGLKVQSEFGKWSEVATTQVRITDGSLSGNVKAADLRTPVREVRLTLRSSHVDGDVLARIASADSSLNTTGDGGIWTETDADGHYAFEHLPMGSYRITASKGSGDAAHEFETRTRITELTLDGPNQQAMDFVDLSVYPVGGFVRYSILKKEGEPVLVQGVEITAQPVGSTSLIKGLPSTKSGNNSNYSVPLFAGKYLFLAEKDGHDIRIVEETPGYDERTGLVTVEEARNDIDFVNHTTRELTVLVEDSGEHRVPGQTVTVSGTNGQAEGVSDEEEGEFTVTLNPGTYTVGVEGADPKEKEVDLTAGDQVVTMTIPVKIELSFDARPKLFDAPDEFLEQFGIDPDDNPEGYMFYYPPALRTHTYTITATANGHPVEDFTLFVTDDVSELTDDPGEEEERFVQGEEYSYIVTAGLPKYTPEDTLAAPKDIRFHAEKEGYLDSDTVKDSVIVLGDVPEGSASRIVSVPIVNYTVLHDPPGDGSYAYLDDSMTISGIEIGMQIKISDGFVEKEIPIYPSPWSDEREIGDFFESEDEEEEEEEEDSNISDSEFRDLKDQGLLGYEDPDHAGAHFTWMAAVEAATGAGIVAMGPWGYGIQLAKLVVKTGTLGRAEVGSGLVQLAVSPNRRLETPSGDEQTDLLGPGKGDIYFGEGWTLGLQTKHRLGIEKNDSTGEWERKTETIETYDILERSNQYVYTIRDIENIIQNLEAAIDDSSADEDEKKKLENAKDTWDDLLKDNLAYTWHNEYVSEGLDFEDFTENDGDDIDTDDGEMLIFSAGPVFEYSRAISRSKTTSFSTEVSVESESEFSHEIKVFTGFTSFGNGFEDEWAAGSSASIGSGTSMGEEWESGTSTEQSVGFVLHDDDIGDNIATRVYADPRWGTPIFFQEPGSYTSDPWESGTNRAVDVRLELEEGPTSGQPFDYREGAHYKIKITYTGDRDLESDFDTADFLLYAPQTDNPDHLTVRFNGNAGPYPIGLTKEGPTALIELSLYPPEEDWGSSEEKEYSVVIQAQEEADAQVSRLLSLNPTFADLLPPRATVIAPYERQRVSPVFFPEDDPFDIEVVSEDTALAKIQIQIRAKQPDGVWEIWYNLDDMVWEEDGENPNVTLSDHLNRRPVRREFTFAWTDTAIGSLGVGEYALHAVATDRAGNIDIDPPSVVFLVDDAKPSVLNTVPDYQARESERTYRGELSITFTDDMRADDFSDRTFAVTDLLEDNKKVAGYVSYSPALRKAIFVPVTPFRPNGFYRAEVKTDVEQNDGTVSRGLHDLAGNPLDNGFSWTFRTKDAPFEETWLVALSATDGIDRDGNNLASVEYGALDDEDEKDARSVPGLSGQMRLTFVEQDPGFDQEPPEFDRDTRPADGRLSHHWYFVVENAQTDATVTIRWRPSIRLTKTTRQYQVIQLTEFDNEGQVANVISLDPGEAETNPETGEAEETEAYTYENAATRGDHSFDTDIRYFRLDVQKSTFVAGTLQAGTSGWQFFSVPIEPERAEPFVNLGDDIDPFQLFQYETAGSEYKVYPFDLGEVALQSGRGYFTRTKEDVDVDVGGALIREAVDVPLDAAGWHAVGNPFVKVVEVADLIFEDGTNSATFAQAAAEENSWIEGTLYRWKPYTGTDSDSTDTYVAVETGSLLDPWQGYWLKTSRDSLVMTISAPDSLPDNPPSPDFLIPSMKPAVSTQATPGCFALRLALRSASASDLTTTLGTHPGARRGWDLFDRSEPPALGRTASAYFDHPECGTRSGRYNRDFQPDLRMGEERTWQLVVYSDQPDAELTLSWEEFIADLAEELSLQIRQLSPSPGDWQEMRLARSLRLDPGGRITKAIFEIRAHWPAVERTALLPSFPNPSNPEVWIPYELAEEGRVEIRIFNLLGQQVRHLNLGLQPRGRYTGHGRAAWWDGRDAQGAPVSSGVYFCVLRTGDFTAMRKLTILK